MIALREVGVSTLLLSPGTSVALPSVAFMKSSSSPMMMSGSVSSKVSIAVGGRVASGSSLEGLPPSDNTVTIKFCPIYYRSRLLWKGKTRQDKTRQDKKRVFECECQHIHSKEANKHIGPRILNKKYERKRSYYSNSFLLYFTNVPLRQ
jgi:hypothetical protein